MTGLLNYMFTSYGTFIATPLLKVWPTKFEGTTSVYKVKLTKYNTNHFF